MMNGIGRFIHGSLCYKADALPMPWSWYEASTSDGRTDRKFYVTVSDELTFGGRVSHLKINYSDPMM